MFVFLIVSLPAGIAAYFAIRPMIARDRSILVPVVIGFFSTSLLLILYWVLLPPDPLNWNFPFRWLYITLRDFFILPVPAFIAYTFWKNKAKDPSRGAEEIFWLFATLFAILTLRDLVSLKSHFGFFHYIHIPVLRLLFLFLLPGFFANILHHEGGGRVLWAALSLGMIIVLGLVATLGRLNFPLASSLSTVGLMLLALLFRFRPDLIL